MGQLQRYALAVVACSVSLASACAAQSPAKVQIINKTGHPGAFEIHALNARLSARASIEKLVKSKWIDVVPTIRLTTDCNAKDEKCAIIDGALKPVPWNGDSCGGQCPASCRKNVPLGPGEFRLVVYSCDRTQRFEGPVFHLAK